jgi:inhibitor of KinA|tara:strand:- start:415 stop:1086 length:672 start_codon:yes stop_codon:yes gene_type:complete
MIKNITNLGDAALYCDFGDEVNITTNSKVINYFKNIKINKIDGITNLAPSYNKLIISFDLNIINFKTLKQKILSLEIKDLVTTNTNKLEIPVCIDNEFALDIERLEKKTNKSFSEIIKNFFDKEYFCYMTGFIAGMPFLGDLEKNLRVKRLETPRVKVPKGSVGITEQFTNIYTFESPGGWNIVGNTPIKIFDKKNKEMPTLINPGDKVKFYEITKKEYKNFQ